MLSLKISSLSGRIFILCYSRSCGQNISFFVRNKACKVLIFVARGERGGLGLGSDIHQAVQATLTADEN